MRILDRYILKRFFVLLFGIMLSLITIFVFLDFIGNLNRFANISTKQTFLYYVFFTPYIFTVIFPVAMLLATMFTTGLMSMNNEISAMQAAGLGIKRIVTPLLVVSVLLCAMVLAINETILPIANLKKSSILDAQNPNNNQNNIKRNLFYQGRDGVMFHFGEYNALLKMGKSVIIEKYKNNTMIYRIKTDSIKWENIHWKLYGVEKYDIEPDIKMQKYAVLDSFKIKDTPSDFVLIKKNPDEMNYFELNKFIDNLRRSGGEPRKYLADLHFKISYPLINLIVVILGVSLTTKVGKRGLARVFGLGLIICFVYYLFSKLGLAFGHSGELPPLFAAWIGNFIFFTIGIFMFIRNSR